MVYKTLLFALAISAAYAAPSAMPGVPRYLVVNDHVWRGGQPTSEGFRNLAAAGVHVVVDLQQKDDRSKAEKRLVESLGMKYVIVPMKGMKTPEDEQISHALKVLDDEKAGPVFVHCHRGADRTGVVIACYRMEHDGWTNRKSLDEARNIGMSWYQIPLQRYILAYRPHDGGTGLVDTAQEAGQNAAEKLKSLPAAVGEIFR